MDHKALLTLTLLVPLPSGIEEPGQAWAYISPQLKLPEEWVQEVKVAKVIESNTRLEAAKQIPSAR